VVNPEPALTHAQLVDPGAFHDWVSKLSVSAENISDLCDQVARDHSAEASLRCAFLAIQVDRWDLVNRYLLDARLNNGPDDVQVAITVLESRRELALSRIEDRVSSVDGPANVIGALLEARKRFQLFPKRRLFTLEQEFFCLLAIANVHHKRREWDASLAILSEALGLAKTLAVPPLVAQAHGMIVNSLTHAGRFSEASEENERILAAGADQRLLSSNFQSNSEIRFRFGAFDEAMQILQSIDMPADAKRNAFDFFDLFRGRFDPSRTPEGRRVSPHRQEPAARLTPTIGSRTFPVGRGG